MYKNMYKKSLAISLAIMILFGSTINTFGVETKKTVVNLESLPAKSIVLMEEQSGRILFKKNADEKTAPASITKIMTMLIIMEAIEEGKISSEDMVICSKHAANMEGATIWFEEGEKLSLNELMKAVAISGANDASVALSEHLAGSEEAFVKMMNNKAQSLGMTNTNFMNASGLGVDNHYTTARDIGIMSCELLKHEKIKEYTTIWMDNLRKGKTELVNTNRLIRFYKGATGLKTGTTAAEGNSISASATRKNLSLIAVVMNAKTSEERFEAAKVVLDYGFANFEAVKAPNIEEDLKPIKVLNGMETTVGVTYEAQEWIALDKKQKNKLTWEISVAEDIKAPVEKGQVLGKAIISIEGKTICEYPLMADSDIEEMTFLRGLGIFCKAISNMK